MAKIKVLLADDHTILRHGLRAMLEREPDIEVVAEAEDGRAAVHLARQVKPDIIVMDIGMPLLNGLEATRQVRAACPAIKILILTMHDNEEYIRPVLAAGAAGYLLKDAAGTALVEAIRAVYRGEAVLSPAITRLVVEDYLRWGEIQPIDDRESLTPREREILQLVAEGYTNRQIAEILIISIKTVQAHCANLEGKLGLKDRSDLIRYAIQKKVIGFPPPDPFN